MVVTTLRLALTTVLGLGGSFAASGPEADASRPIDNHDGTFTVQVSPVCLSDSGADTLSCDASGTVEEFTWRTGEQYYSRSGPDLYYYEDGQFSDHGYVRFDLQAVPDSATVIEASCHWFQYSIAGDHVVTVVRWAAVDPDSVDDRTLYLSVHSGLPISDAHDETYRGWIHRPLNDAGLRAVESCLAQDWITLGIVLTADLNAGRAYGYTAANSPRLAVTYSPQPGVVEEAVHPRLPRFVLSPNPASDRTRASFSLPHTGRSDLTIVDPTGRVVWSSFITGPAEAAARLPPLPPGVYLVRLESGSFTETRKLIIE